MRLHNIFSNISFSQQSIYFEEEGSTGLTDNEDSDDDDVVEDSQGF